MKNFLHALPYFLLFLVLAYIPPKSYGQCLCSGGVAPNVLEHRFQLAPTSASTSVISFPKFPIALGTLTCVSFYDTLSIEAQTGARNLDPTSGHEPSFQLTLTTNVKGPNPLSPSININDLINVVYGPDSLQVYGTPGDSITYGPDTVYNKVAKQRTSSSNLGDYYTGTGDVEFMYNISGGAIPIFDGTNYSVTVRTNTWGSFRLVYYWCEGSLLATNIKNFSASKKDKSILLSWITENKTSGTQYEIESSTDGINFSRIGQTASKDFTAGPSQEQFQYTPEFTASGKLYFRLKQIDAEGKATFSPIRSVNMNENAAAGFIIYPNPVTRKVFMQFDRHLSGNYVIDISNLAGQKVYNRTVTINNTNNVQFDLTNPPPSGIYYLKITDTKTRLSYTNKLVVRQ